MKVVILACVVAAVVAVGEKEPVPIISLENNINPDGTFISTYETGDGIRASNEGVLVPAADPKEPDAVGHKGSFSYTSPDGTPIQLSYIADATGYHPEGSHLPVPHEIPEAIARAIKWNLDHPAPDDSRQK